MKLAAIFLIGIVSLSPGEWKTLKNDSFSIYYTDQDNATYEKYIVWVKEGKQNAEQFFGKKFTKEFIVYLHPTRSSLDEQWQKDWQMPGFKSECWMVASGVATKLDLLSPRVWATQSCEHNEADLQASKQIVLHELVHVFHGQQNASPDFSAANGIDWLVEGLATYASGQCTATKLAEIKAKLKDSSIPMDLNKFWTGKWRYGLSGSMVMFIDKTFGREKLIQLLAFANKEEVLKTLQVNEEKLLSDWKKFILDLKV